MRGGVPESDIELVDLSRGALKGVFPKISLFLKFLSLGAAILCLLAYFLCSATESLYEVCIEGLGLVRGLHSTERLTGLEFLNRLGDTTLSIPVVAATCENTELFCDSCLAGNLVKTHLGLLCKSESDLVVFGRDLLPASTSSFVSPNGVEISASSVLACVATSGPSPDASKFSVLLKLVVSPSSISVSIPCCWELV